MSRLSMAQFKTGVSFLKNTRVSSLTHLRGHVPRGNALAASHQQARSFSAVDWHGTTIVCVRKDGMVCMAGDGQVSQGSTVVKGNARKVRRIGDGILVGFAGSTADAMTLLERLEKKLEEHPQQLTRACVELAKAWRTDKYLRRLEAVLLVADRTSTFELTGNGDVLEPQSGVMGVGSGGTFALSAALALMDQDNMNAEQIARKAMKIAGDICVYTNHNILVEVLERADPSDAKDAKDAGLKTTL